MNWKVLRKAALITVGMFCGLGVFGGLLYLMFLRPYAGFIVFGALLFAVVTWFMYLTEIE